jgi:polyphosphate kinase
METHMADNQSSWRLAANGAYQRVAAKRAAKVRSQEVLYNQACEAIAAASKKRRTRFEPHRPEPSNKN